MTPKTLREAIAEAQRFVSLAKKVKPSVYEGKESPDYVERGPDAAAAKRASLDLTKALARMRKPQ
jgi:hypothetical protein